MRKINYLAMLATTTLLSYATNINAQEKYSFGDASAAKIGVEVFRDVYREPTVDVTDSGEYIALTGTYTTYWNLVGGERNFIAFDGRASYGNIDYKSPSGESSGQKQFEFDTRILLGLEYPSFLGFSNGALSPYTGLGWRYYMDQSKGSVTNLGFLGYDRRIGQFYIPFGLIYDYKIDESWTISPVFEVDVLVSGMVNSRLQNIPGFDEIKNRQDSGYGLRAEFFASYKDATNNLTWQFGPYIRFWEVKDSNITFDSSGTGWLEPENTRLQYGLAAKILW
jgi:hypothetical protein